ncbi:amino acid deaminase [Variovorax boronicumulans]|uniref:amino acid deaminase n=1 Tax=Variovorax boronicumulans TaxID=436515 RepID=UPI001C57390B
MLRTGVKGFPHDQAPLSSAEIGGLGWNLLDGRLPLPLAVLKRTALEHNLRWMQQFVRSRGIDLAPHGKTTMSPQLFARQLEAGAWGLTVANVTQLCIAVAAGVRRVLLANQVLADEDLAGIQAMLKAHADLRVVFLVDSNAQLALVEGWFSTHQVRVPFEVMLEIGMLNARTGCRTHDEAMLLARALHASAAVRLVGIECYEGLGVSGRTERDASYADALMARVEAIARCCDAEGLFEAEEVLVSAGGSSIFDLVAGRLKPSLGRPVRGLLRSGCYITHDHGHCQRMGVAMRGRTELGEGLQPALEVWTHVQSRPEPGLAILAVGRRDISFDIEMPVPLARAARDVRMPRKVPPSWRITALNDQHGYLRWDAHHEGDAPTVGERVGLGISHPCTTFDKWQWMPVVEDDYRVSDAVTIHF